MKVSTVIPRYNEKDTIEKVVEFVGNAPLNTKDIIVMDDCSQDGTQTLLREKISEMVDQIYLSSDKPMEVATPRQQLRRKSLPSSRREAVAFMKSESYGDVHGIRALDFLFGRCLGKNVYLIASKN